MLSYLYEAIVRNGIKLDNWAIAYAALWLLEKKNLSYIEDYDYILTDLLSKVEKDSYLRRSTRVGDLVLWFSDLKHTINNWRHNLEEIEDYSLIPVRIVEPDIYLSNFAIEYMYVKLRDILPSVEFYLDNKENKKNIIRLYEFTASLIVMKIKDGLIADVENALEYIRLNELEDLLNRYIYPTIADKLAYEDVKLWIPDDVWKVALSRGKGPIDPISFYDALRFSTHYTLLLLLTRAYKAIEPEEFISLLNRLVVEGPPGGLTPKERYRLIIDTMSWAKEYGYSYFFDMLEIVKRKEQI